MDLPLWAIVALIAAAAQTARNATQSHLTHAIGTIGATQVRFLFGLPFAILFLGLVSLIGGEAPPVPTPRSLTFAGMGAVAQIGATALMLWLMKARSFAVTTAWMKTEPIIVALVGGVVLQDPLTPAVLVAIVIATAGVLLSTVAPGAGRGLMTDLKGAALGLVAAGLFGLAAIGFRGGILAQSSGSYLMRATETLVISLFLQTLILLVWMALFDRAALAGSLRVWKGALGAGFLGAFASQFWFLGFALTSAANIRTLALVEMIFAQAVSHYIFRQPVGRRQLLGMAVIMLGVEMLLQAQA